ncbi:type IX secretion system periplasmic lipoprotein PorW/SprE [Flavobacterium humi]|uniref:type IX secretion system periplasmic lipoprotein PorW/SprE n=1 Tax=Flavobacterium humi TaxID=2562683 RepID=UPI00146EF35A|nr:gliding motility protein [Flavobacterium humi]
MLKINRLKYISGSFLILFLVACSTKRNSFVNRNWHAVNTEYNTLYNGDIALEAGINELKTGYKDNFWEILPVERMQVAEEAMLPGQKGKNQNFDRAETKATKAIQKHSMNIEGKEKNMQMDEAHLLLGKSRYYDQRFIPALEAFNYILYKYSDSDKIYEAKVWREKTNLRLENDALAIKNLKKLIKNKDLKPQVFADANATLSQAYINLEQQDSAIAPLKMALGATKFKEERARYHFILGQLYEKANYKDSAYAEFQQIIDMKRKSPRHYVIRAHAQQAQLIDPTTDTVAFLEKYAKLLKDRENRPYLDVLNYQVASFYDKLNQKEQAVKFYNKSLRSPSEDAYLQATTYKNLATIYFDKAKYLTAGQYYDSTLTKLVKKDREYFAIVKKRENLVDVIRYEGIVQHNDSILKLVALSDNDKKAYFDDYILKLKAKDEAKRVLEEKQKEAAEKANAGIKDIEVAPGKAKAIVTNQLPKLTSDDPKNGGAFYFYTPATVAYGKIEFQKRWGKRALKDNWRWSVQSEDIKDNNDQPLAEQGIKKDSAAVSEKYNTEFYVKQLPTSQVVIDSLAKERNFANYQLGVIYKEKFKENKLAVNKFETVLKSTPEERLILPSMYNLYKLYEISDKAKAEAIKSQIISNYPNTRYAQILSGTLSEENIITQTPDEVYKGLYKQFGNQEYAAVLATIEKSLTQFAGDDLIPKYELLKASAIGKLKGVEEYKKAVNYVALTYPNSKEGKQAEDILRMSVPGLEKMALKQDSLAKNWKIIYKAGKRDDVETTKLMEKLNKYIAEKQFDKFSVSYDVYSENENFIVLHGVSSKEFSKYLIDALKEAKDYKITTPANVISSGNYAVIQVKKNYNEFLELK